MQCSSLSSVASPAARLWRVRAAITGAFVALLAAAIVLAAVIWIRVWWLNQKLGPGRKIHVNQRQRTGAGAEVIEGEFRVVSRERERDSGR